MFLYLITCNDIESIHGEYTLNEKNLIKEKWQIDVDVLVGKSYAGWTYDLENRWKVHLRTAFVENRSFVLSSALRKHGKEMFTYQIIKEFDTHQDVLDAECQLISDLKLNVNRFSDFGFNMTDGGEGTFGHKKSSEFCEAAKIRMSFSIKEAWKDPQKRQQMLDSRQKSAKLRQKEKFDIISDLINKMGDSEITVYDLVQKSAMRTDTIRAILGQLGFSSPGHGGSAKTVVWKKQSNI